LLNDATGDIHLQDYQTDNIQAQIRQAIFDGAKQRRHLAEKRTHSASTTMTNTDIDKSTMIVPPRDTSTPPKWLPSHLHDRYGTIGNDFVSTRFLQTHQLPSHRLSNKIFLHKVGNKKSNLDTISQEELGALRDNETWEDVDVENDANEDRTLNTGGYSSTSPYTTDG